MSQRAAAKRLEPLGREPREDDVERLLLAHPGEERLVAPEAGGQLQHLALVLAQALERADQEVGVATGVPTSSVACQAASIERSS